MRKIGMIALFLWIGILPISSNAQFSGPDGIWFPDGSQAGQPCEMKITVTFNTSGYSITNYTADVSGDNIDVTIYASAPTGYVFTVITYEQAVIQIPALPEGTYTCNITTSGGGSVFPGTIEFSVPQPAGSYFNDQFHLFGETSCLTNINNTLKYVHKKRLDTPYFQYISEARTNLTGGAWTPLTGAETNRAGEIYNEITYDVPTTNSQLFIRTRVLVVE